MVKKLKSEKIKQKNEDDNLLKSKKEQRNAPIKENKKNESVLLKNIKEKRLNKKNMKVNKRQINEKKYENKDQEKEEEEEEEEIDNSEDKNKLEEEDEEIEKNNFKDENNNNEDIEEEGELEEMEEDEENEENEENEEEEEEEGGDKEELEEKEEGDKKNNSSDKEDKEEEDEIEDNKNKKDLKFLKNSISEHYYTFQYPKDLYTLLYTSLIFKWIDTTKILILCNTPKEGYKIDIFLRQFNFNTIYLDKEMPLNTNNHFYSQYLKNVYKICIINLEYSERSKNFSKEILDNTKIPITIIYFDCFSQSLLEYHSFHPNTREIYHFISNKDNFLDAYENLDENINFNEFVFDREQMEHLRYRAEDMLNGIKKSDIKKEKMRKINIELLHSKKMQKFFKENPKERENIVKNIDENTIKSFAPSVSFLPSYLVHNENNVIADAIKKEYKDKKRNNNKRRKKQKKMELYFEALDKGDGSQNLIQF